MTESEPEHGPTVSVVMSVFNGSRYLRPAVDSILAQTHADFEFLIVDDGSTDDTATILAGYARTDARVRIFTQTNTALAASLNRALALARGRYIARMDSDDIALPGRFASQVRFLDHHPECVIVGGGVCLIDADGRHLCRRRQPRRHAEIDRACLLGQGGAMTHPAVMIRRSALAVIGGYDERYTVAGDLDLFLRLCEVGRGENLEETVLLWRQHPASINATQSGLWRNTKQEILREALQRRGIESVASVLAEDGGAALFKMPYEYRCFRYACAGRHYFAMLVYLWRDVKNHGFRSQCLAAIRRKFMRHDRAR
jgi:glycosyltransferase involved in cell wall biosynthesis